ncbi:MAG: glucosaminidase domain-containing protein [Chloroflexi bacterium]|nr:glucosaminidase domain-containing protein [Chloroflexota bacterium]
MQSERRARGLWSLILFAISAAVVVVANRPSHGIGDAGPGHQVAEASAPVVAAAVQGSPVSAPVFVPTVSRDEPEVAPEPDARVVAVEVAMGRFEGSPLVSLAGWMVAEADRVGLDWRLLPAIAIRESGAGTASCIEYNNPFGWGSCVEVFGARFDSWAAGVTRVAAALAWGSYYAGRPLEERLCIYNRGLSCWESEPGARYASEVMAIMRGIGDGTVGP